MSTSIPISFRLDRPLWLRVYRQLERARAILGPDAPVTTFCRDLLILGLIQLEKQEQPFTPSESL